MIPLDWAVVLIHGMVAFMSPKDEIMNFSDVDISCIEPQIADR